MAGSDHRELARKVLGNPENYPDELKAWVPRILEGNPNLVIQQSQLPALEPVRYIGATGQPVFANSWVNYDTGFSQASYYKDPWETVHLDGLIKNGTITAVAFVLPAGYRPKLRTIFVADSNNAHGRLDIYPTGDVIPLVGNNTYFALGGISFRAYT